MQLTTNTDVGMGQSGFFSLIKWTVTYQKSQCQLRINYKMGLLSHFKAESIEIVNCKPGLNFSFSRNVQLITILVTLAKTCREKGENRSGVGGVVAVAVAALHNSEPNVIFLRPCINRSERQSYKYLQLKGSNVRDACMGPLSLKLCVSLNQNDISSLPCPLFVSR